MSEESRSQVWLQMYHRNNNAPVRVNFTLGVQSEDPVKLAESADQFVTILRERGFVPVHPGETEKVPGGDYRVADSVLRSCWTRKDGKQANRIDFFRDGDQHKGVHWYLNNEADYWYFEESTGVSMGDLITNEGYPNTDRGLQGVPLELEYRLPFQVQIVRKPVLDKETGLQKMFNEFPVFEFDHFVGYPRGGVVPQATISGSVTVDPGSSNGSNWKTEIAVGEQTPEELLRWVRVAMADKCIELQEQHAESLLKTPPDGLAGENLLNWYGFDLEWTRRMFKDELGFRGMFAGKRIEQANMAVDVFAGNFLYECVQMTPEQSKETRDRLAKTVDAAKKLQTELDTEPPF